MLVHECSRRKPAMFFWGRAEVFHGDFVVSLTCTVGFLWRLLSEGMRLWNGYFYMEVTTPAWVVYLTPTAAKQKISSTTLRAKPNNESKHTLLCYGMKHLLLYKTVEHM